MNAITPATLAFDADDALATTGAPFQIDQQSGAVSPR